MESFTLPPNQPLPPAGQEVRASSSSMAVVAVVLGILSLSCCMFFSGIPAIFIGRSEMSRLPPHTTDHTLAKLGAILGGIGTTLWLIFIAIYLGMFALGVSMVNHFSHFNP